MTEQEFKQFLARPESDTIDFKQEHYDFSGADNDEKTRKRGKFLKDIISMKNTPRQEAAYVILGVKRNPDGTNEIIGIAKSIDDAELQEKFQSWVFPHPFFRYEQITYGGLIFGVIQIPCDRTVGPCFCLKDIPGAGVRAKTLYFRRGSRNSEADFAEQKAIFQWFEPSTKIGLAGTGDDSSWDQFVRSVEGLTPERKYVLATSRLEPAALSVGNNIGLVDWLFAADFDPASDASGLLQHARVTLEAHRTIHRLTRGDQMAFNPEMATYWYFARGIQGRDTSLGTGRWSDWHRAFESDLRDKLSKIAVIFPNPITVIVLWDDQNLLRHLNTFLETVMSIFSGRAQICLLCQNKDAYAEIAEAFGASLVEIPFHQFLDGLATLKMRIPTSGTEPVCLPSSSGADVEVKAHDFTWIEEELTIVHKRIGYRPPADALPEQAFLKGRQISWFDLGLHVDVERDIADKIKQAIRNDLTNRRISRINLFHGPGAGGSTLARRILWDFRNEYPTLIVRRTTPRETIDKIAKIFSLSDKPILIQIDGSEITEAKSEELYNLLASRNLPCVLLQVWRRFRKPKEAERSFYLNSFLSSEEAVRFLYNLSREAPTRKNALENAIARQEERTPFLLGLIAFERDFISLQPYVANHLTPLPDTARKALIYFALAHFYGQQLLPAQAFAPFLNLPEGKVLRLQDALPDAALALLTETIKGFWRTTHYLIAEELIQQGLSLPEGERRLWRDRLADWAIEFANFCHGGRAETSHQNLDVVRRVFVFREESDLLGTERAGERLYSQLISDIRVQEGQLRVLIHLTDLFPNEAHFWAHLGRYYSNELGNFEKAVAALDRALSLSPDDHLLHHMKGMAFRNAVYASLHGQHIDLASILSNAKQASESFLQARLHSPDDDHGFISEVQLIARVLDFYGKRTKTEALLAASRHPDSWLREGFQVAEDLLLQVRGNHQGERPSEYEERCRAELDVLYGNHGRALEIWQNLLDRRNARGQAEFYAPPIRRQIVWTHLSRNSRQWQNLSPKDLERSVHLLDQNLTEEPGDDKNIKLWIRAVRFLPDPPSIENVIERVAYWRSRSNSIEAIYYLFVLYSLLSINGSSLAGEKAQVALDECRIRSRFHRRRTWSYEWLGKASGLKQLVDQDELGAWDLQKNFWTNPDVLIRVSGLIGRILGPQAGEIELKNGLKAFFVPGGSGHSLGRSENLPVNFCLGFSYDGLRAWGVKDS
jgi:tetratricopeptide (TPR) repeat protein